MKSMWSSIAAFGKKRKKSGQGRSLPKNYFEVSCTLGKGECNDGAQIIRERDYH